MFDKPLLTNNTLTVNFEIRQDIRKLASKIEDKLCNTNTSFTQPITIPVPDEIEPSLARIVFGTTHDFTQIVISQSSITLNMKYSDDYQKDLVSCEKYINKHTPLLYTVVDKIIKRPVLFTGLASVVNVVSKTTDEIVIKRISDLYNVKADNLFDIDLKFTSVIENKYFKNLKVQNFRQFDNAVFQNKTIPVPNGKAKSRGIQIILDFNDRYLYNETPNYKGSWPKCSNLIRKSFEQLEIEKHKFQK